MNTITVNLPVPPAISYEIQIGAGLLRELGPRVRALAATPTCGLVSDTNVAPRYLAAARAGLAAAGFRVIEYVFPAGERHKTLATVAAGLDIFLTPPNPT
ncbi:MAG: hypothetical protein WCI73_01755, partial [Phycisphaerae bacterium]